MGHLNIEDHDLLVRLDEKMDTVQAAVAELKKDTIDKVEKLESRLDATRVRVWMITGGCLVAEFILGLLFKSH